MCQYSNDSLSGTLIRRRFWIDTLPLNKSDVLPFIDGTGSVPAKYARAIIFEGGKPEPDSQEYMIGPLPVTATTTIQKLDYIYNGGKGGSVPYNARYFDSPRSTATEPLIVSIMSNISDITAALFQGGVYYGSRDNRSAYPSRSHHAGHCKLTFIQLL
jgi:primary-amine oxidase